MARRKRAAFGVSVELYLWMRVGDLPKVVSTPLFSNWSGNMLIRSIHADEATQQAARNAAAVQDAVNLRAIVAQLLEDIDSMRRTAGLDGNGVNNHPVVLAYVSKLNSLCRMTTEREMAALQAIDQLAQGQDVECEVLPI